jgi:hypothetical protein
LDPEKYFGPTFGLATLSSSAGQMVGERMMGAAPAAPFQAIRIDEVPASVIDPLCIRMAASENVHRNLHCGQAGLVAHHVDNVVDQRHRFNLQPTEQGTLTRIKVR